jgi:periplasmic divalent cation tolerance protein
MEPTVMVVLMTAPDEATGTDLAARLVEERLAACVNVVPGVRSVFRWDGKVQDELEVMLVGKTVESSVDALRARVLELHPYDVPELLVFPVARGHGPYLDWVREEVRSTA